MSSGAGQGAAHGDARGGQQAATYEVLVDGAGGAAAFVDGPDDEGLAAATVAGDEYAFHIGGEFAVLADKGLPVPARVLGLEPEHFVDLQFGADKAVGEQYEVSGPFLFGAFHLSERRPTLDRLGPVHLDGFNALNVAVAVIDKYLRKDLILARVVAVLCLILLV